MRYQSLSASIEGDELVIRVGIGTLAIAASHCPLLVEWPGEVDPPYATIDDETQLGKDVAGELLSEEEDGSSPLTGLLDRAIKAAWDDGSIAFRER